MTAGTVKAGPAPWHGYGADVGVGHNKGAVRVAINIRTIAISVTWRATASVCPGRTSPRRLEVHINKTVNMFAGLSRRWFISCAVQMARIATLATDFRVIVTDLAVRKAAAEAVFSLKVLLVTS